MREQIAVSEMFGPTIQGEGPSAGRRAIFLRTAGCNLTCQWCDTKYTWDWEQFDKSKEVKKMSIDDVARRLTRLRGSDFMIPPPILVITGGEPMLQIRECHLAASTVGLWPRIEIETNGTIPPSVIEDDVRFNVSPKLQSADVAYDTEDEKNLNIISDYATDDRTACFKFVIEDEDDLDQARLMISNAGIPPEYVYLMPQTGLVYSAGTGNHHRWVAEQAIRYGYNYSDRLHTRLWGSQRGR